MSGEKIMSSEQAQQSKILIVDDAVETLGLLFESW
jgi:hypothetical protein